MPGKGLRVANLGKQAVFFVNDRFFQAAGRYGDDWQTDRGGLPDREAESLFLRRSDQAIGDCQIIGDIRLPTEKADIEVLG